MARIAVANRTASTSTGNILYNGGFEIAPTFVAATTTTSRWIDGTAAGSAALASRYGWGVNITGTDAAQFDNSVFRSGSNSLKLSTLAAASFLEARPVIGTVSAIKINNAGIRAVPNTSYTVTYWMKTNFVSGSATNGARVDCLELSSTSSTLVTNSVGSYVKITTDWTQYTFTFTTNASTVYLMVRPEIYGHQGAATLIMDAWFDDITVVCNAGIGRVAASGRTAA